MNVCANCGAENFDSNLSCLVCGEPLTPLLHNANKKPSNVFSYETDHSYFMTKLLPIAYVIGIFVISLPVMIMQTPMLFRIIWIISALLMLFMAFSYYWLYPTLTIGIDHIKLTTLFDEYAIISSQIKNIIDIDMMFMPNKTRIDMEGGPIFYRVNGILFGAWGKPMFLIDKSITNYPLLKQLLIEKTGIKPKKVIF